MVFLDLFEFWSIIGKEDTNDIPASIEPRRLTYRHIKRWNGFLPYPKARKYRSEIAYSTRFLKMPEAMFYMLSLSWCFYHNRI